MKSSSPFQTLHHVCLVVRDIDAAVAFYTSLGISPWHDYPPLEQYTDLTVPDRSGFLALRYKFANIANVQIQLCEPTTGDTPQGQFLATRGEGVFHLGFTVANCNAGEEAARKLGLSIQMRGRRPDGSGFTYFNTASQGAGVTLEIRATPQT
jgi:methylmalonyl-CoA/ethylmalonyl-CoA epimerase